MAGARTRAVPGWLRWLAAIGTVTPVQRWLVLVHSVPAGEQWRSGCPHCAGPVSPAAGFGPLLPAARCRSCGERTGAHPYLLEATTLVAAALVVVAVAGGGWSWPAAVALAGWAAVAVPLSFIDLAVHRLPDRLTLPAAAWVLAWLGAAWWLDPDPGRSWVRAAVAAAAVGLVFAIITLIFGARGFGLGDAKLALGAVALLGWPGWTAVVTGLFLAFLASGLVAAGLLIARRVGRRDTLPFGPFLAGATLVTLAWVGLS